MTVEQLYKSFCAFCGEQIGFADQPAAVRDENGKLMQWKCWNKSLEAKTAKDSKMLGYLEQLRMWGCGWRSYTQPFLDTGDEMTNGIVLSVLAAVAKQERITLSERTVAGLQRARRARKRLDAGLYKPT